jgi:hypothetical protein
MEDSVPRFLHARETGVFFSRTNSSCNSTDPVEVLTQSSESLWSDVNFQRPEGRITRGKLISSEGRDDTISGMRMA